MIEGEIIFFLEQLFFSDFLPCCEQFTSENTLNFSEMCFPVTYIWVLYCLTALTCQPTPKRIFLAEFWWILVLSLISWTWARVEIVGKRFFWWKREILVEFLKFEAHGSLWAGPAAFRKLKITVVAQSREVYRSRRVDALHINGFFAVTKLLLTWETWSVDSFEGGRCPPSTRSTKKRYSKEKKFFCWWFVFLTKSDERRKPS